jgi:hypothetical protein
MRPDIRTVALYPSVYHSMKPSNYAMSLWLQLAEEARAIAGKVREQMCDSICSGHPKIVTSALMRLRCRGVRGVNNPTSHSRFCVSQRWRPA